jgi:hypothetical protein
MPSSRTLAVALAALVLLAGCSAIPGVDDSNERESPRPDAPDHHGFAVTTDTGGTAVDVAVTVTKDGEEIVAREFSSDGDGRFLRLGTVNESGPYTVTVNTTLPASGGGNMSEQTTVNGTLGNETIVDVTYTDVEFPSIRLPRQELSQPLNYRKARVGKPVGSNRILVEYQGETIVSKTLRKEAKGPFDIASLSKTGLYRVSARSAGGRWTNETVVVRDPDARLFVEMEVFPNVRVYGPDEQLPRL